MIKEVWFSKLARFFGFVVITQEMWDEINKKHNISTINPPEEGKVWKWVYKNCSFNPSRRQ